MRALVLACSLLATCEGGATHPCRPTVPEPGCTLEALAEEPNCTPAAEGDR